MLILRCWQNGNHTREVPGLTKYILGGHRIWTKLHNSMAVSRAVGSLGSGKKHYALDNQSIIVRMAVWLMELGGSMTMCGQVRWGTINGCNSPAGSCREDLEILQVEQLWMKVMVSDCRMGHKKHLERRWIVAAIPGWLELGDEWTYWMTTCKVWMAHRCDLGGIRWIWCMTICNLSHNVPFYRSQYEHGRDYRFVSSG